MRIRDQPGDLFVDELRGPLAVDRALRRVRNVEEGALVGASNVT